MGARRRFWRERGRWLVLLALALAVAASAFALLAPTGTEEEATEAVPEGTPQVEIVAETRSTTLLGQIQDGEEDASVLVWLVVPIAIAAVPVAFAKARFERASTAAAAALLLAFSFVTGFSIGLFYLPSALAMLAAAVVARSA